MTGAEDNIQRGESKQKFQECKRCKVRFDKHENADHAYIPSDNHLIALNMVSSVEGHTLTASRQTAWIEIPWTAKDVDQGEARVYRMSQLNATMHTFFIGRGTIDEWLYEIVTKKRAMANAITGKDESTEEIIIDKLWTLFNQTEK